MKSETQLLNAARERPQASEDDYSVPYELKIFSGDEGTFEHFLASLSIFNFVTVGDLHLVVA